MWDYLCDVPHGWKFLIFIKHEENIKTRGIFNTVNKYVKPTSAGDNIINALHDGFAILTRKLIDKNGGILRESVVNWRNNTLTDKSDKFTTIKILYDTVTLMLKGLKMSLTLIQQQGPRVVTL